MKTTVRVRKSAIFNTTERRWAALQQLAGKKPITEYLMDMVEEKHGTTLARLEEALAKVEEALDAVKEPG